MKFIYLYLLTLSISIPSLAQQKSSVNWGEDIKLKKGSTDLKVVCTDNTGIYLEEAHIKMKSYFVVGATFRGSGTLIKMNANLSEIYRRNYNKDLRGKEFEQFFPLGNDLFIFASSYSRGDRMLELFAAKVNKASGDLTVRWQRVASFQQESKKDKIEFKLTYNADSSKMVLVSSIQGKEMNEYKVQEFDSKLKGAKPVVISNEFEAKKYQLEDVIYTINRKVILVGRTYEYEEGKKKKEKFLDFNHYNIRVYNEAGKQESEINTTVNGKWLSSTKLLQEKNQDLILAAFYSNEKKSRRVNGLLVQRIDVNTGKVISTIDKAINDAMLSNGDNVEDDDKEDGKEAKDNKKDKERKDAKEDKDAKNSKDSKTAKAGKENTKDGKQDTKEEGEGFSRYMQFRKIFYSSDGGLMILAESFDTYTYTTSTYTPGTNGAPGHWSYTTYRVYSSGDLLMCKVAPQGEIDWLQVLPKSQSERYAVGTTSTGGGATISGFSFFSSLKMPFYSGFGVVRSGNTINLVLNDNPKNAGVTQSGQKVKSVTRFGKSDCFMISVDELTGKISRKMIFNNKEIPTAMPRKGVVLGNNLYLVGRNDRMFGKTKIAVGKISVK
ncbi:hypothetical protein [[Flexibacter] sp. ATCC 35208]|uniref:hypothetical protein n=1 Tax=[Flexibacter] sp. ATCC 35208 TaxID=1936242 RepID=UPI0009C91377|nr:hypothetical protein [[Flexibacter] sp. ATCC 35208]OMP74992.1 hypothetical protein BW716_32430 [[Flexibacter] sp. ATCC 35208]